MEFTRRCTVVLLIAAGAAGACGAQSAVPPPPRIADLPPAPARAASTPVATAFAPAPSEAPASAAPRRVGQSSKRVIEDDKVRIEETRLRGQPQVITVHSKWRGGGTYEIILPPLGKDPSQDRGAAGQRTWSIFDF